jgi:hypothetical protein
VDGAASGNHVIETGAFEIQGKTDRSHGFPSGAVKGKTRSSDDLCTTRDASSHQRACCKNCWVIGS